VSSNPDELLGLGGRAALEDEPWHLHLQKLPSERTADRPGVNKKRLLPLCAESRNGWQRSARLMT